MLVWFLFFTFLSSLLHFKASLLHKTEKNLILLTQSNYEKWPPATRKCGEKPAKYEKIYTSLSPGLTPKLCACRTHPKNHSSD